MTSIHSILDSTVLVASAFTAVCVVWALRTHKRLSDEKDKLVLLKKFRIFSSCLISVAQASIVTLRVKLHNPVQWSESMVQDTALLSALALYTACQPCVWAGLATLRLLPAVLCILVGAAASLASDCVPQPGAQPHAYDTDRVASIVGHSVLVVGVLGMV
eukprot:CAMPEP_0202879676 /NCGR_PEP_ID=MMETSP1391-20130828/33965_1 /ASSEMBLY_ACC=CAM_ASM_000867 /TAXON_ID=1034604 /ORGANISM="Chlamydomonas leiostraca, Strain SAG 11-49" /LENGTH=159 /DNA_ID=CAMNT_0049562069 /DNA_START=43 /DNA_END=519 /DNA_ORIENTATION=-